MDFLLLQKPTRARRKEDEKRQPRGIDNNVRGGPTVFEAIFKNN